MTIHASAAELAILRNIRDIGTQKDSINTEIRDINKKIRDITDRILKINLREIFLLRDSNIETESSSHTGENSEANNIEAEDVIEPISAHG